MSTETEKSTKVNFLHEGTEPKERGSVAQEPVMKPSELMAQPSAPEKVQSVREVNEYQMDFSVKALPSKGLTYPEGWTVKYKPFVFGEVRYLNNSKLSLGDKYRYLMKGIFSSFPVGDLTLADFLYILVLRKVSSLGDDLAGFKYTCASCGGSNDEILTKNQLQFEFIKAPSFPFTAHFSFGDKQFIPLTLDRFLEMSDVGRGDDDVFALVKSCIIEDYSPKVEKELYSQFFEAQSRDAEILEMVDGYLYHGIKDLDIFCKKCSARNLVELDGGDILITPFRESSESLGDAIEFGA